MKDNKEQWEEGMLENNSYYDIDIINKTNKPIFTFRSNAQSL